LRKEGRGREKGGPQANNISNRGGKRYEPMAGLSQENPRKDSRRGGKRERSTPENRDRGGRVAL